MELSYQERMELNACLSAVFDERFDEETLKTIIKYCHALPDQSIQISFTRKGGNSESFSGHTANGEDLKVHTENDSDQTWKIGAENFRVGDFKVARNKNVLGFRRFWASDDTTNADDAPVLRYEIIFNKETLAPIGLSKIGFKTLTDTKNSFFFLKLDMCFPQVLWGIDKRKPSIKDVEVRLRIYSLKGKIIFTVLIATIGAVLISLICNIIWRIIEIIIK